MTHNHEEKFETLIRVLEKLIICSNDQAMAENEESIAHFLDGTGEYCSSLLVTQMPIRHWENGKLNSLGENNISRFKRSLEI